tara:strand:- start:1063 stop:1299 length:237 start_codon:yes stop_codon:yes gene_type:complete
MDREEVIRRLKNRVDDGRSSSAEAIINLIDALHECGLDGAGGALDHKNIIAAYVMVCNPDIAKELYEYLRSIRVHRNL